MIQVENLSFSYGSHPILQNVSFTLEQGECVAVLGNNGAGKSTLISCISRLRKPSSGNVLIDKISKPITDNQVNIELANYLTFDIPVSGTSFTGGFYTVAGLSLLALAVIGLFYIKISRYRNNKS